MLISSYENKDGNFGNLSFKLIFNFWSSNGYCKWKKMFFGIEFVFFELLEMTCQKNVFCVWSMRAYIDQCVYLQINILWRGESDL